MNIEKARELKVGDRVICPPDRGDAGYSGTVTHLTENEEYTNIHGDLYRWVSVRLHGTYHSTVWPSNRLG